ncbi:hypothetical protein ACJX0J_022183, partial [Zea mays]
NNDPKVHNRTINIHNFHVFFQLLVNFFLKNTGSVFSVIILLLSKYILVVSCHNCITEVISAVVFNKNPSSFSSSFLINVHNNYVTEVNTQTFITDEQQLLHHNIFFVMRKNTLKAITIPLTMDGILPYSLSWYTSLLNIQ